MAAQLTIDIGSIPITGQTLAILIWAFFLDPKESFITISAYLILGFCGLPIFADGSHGLAKLFEGSGGFLVGFLVATVLVSYLRFRFKSSFAAIFGLTLFGTVVILVLGTCRLAMLYGFEKGLIYGFYPFWKGAIVKVILGSVVVWFIKNKYINHKKQAQNQM